MYGSRQEVVHACATLYYTESYLQTGCARITFWSSMQDWNESYIEKEQEHEGYENIDCQGHVTLRYE